MTTALPHDPVAAGVPYPDLFRAAAEPPSVVAPRDRATLGEYLRCALGLSAWKQAGRARWALRVNPSSGNLHPTEAYVLALDSGAGAASGEATVSHYDPQSHALETRCTFDADAWRGWTDAAAVPDEAFVVILTSVHWREAWKYGERAFRYCQHDIGHALGALRLSAARLGWSVRLLPWTHDLLAAASGVDRAGDYADAEPEEPAVALLVSPVPHGAGDAREAGASGEADAALARLRAAIAGGAWTGHASRLSPEVVPWPIIDTVAEATRAVDPVKLREALDPGLDPGVGSLSGAAPASAGAASSAPADAVSAAVPSARDVILHRRSALGFDPQGWVHLESLLVMLRRLNAADRAPWDLMPWEPLVHLVLFVHRVEGLAPGIYAWLRGGTTPEAWRTTLRPDFLWEPVPGATDGDTGLFLLAPLDVRPWAQRLSCDQDIAADGFLSLAMLARTGVIAERGGWWYRRLFWECGLIGQLLYLDAEAAGARSTGIGCFFDDAVHQTLGLTGDAWQSLYHFSMGLPVDDARLTTEPGYPWDQPAAVDSD